MAGPKALALGAFISLVLAHAARADLIGNLSLTGADAFVNMGGSPYPSADGITTGNAQPWYDSAQITSLFGGVPSAQQQSDFANTVLQRVERTFWMSGVAVALTDDPSVSANHTLSVVSNTSSSIISNAIGMTYLGGNGFSFIDHIAPLASNVDQLEWIVAHNVAHELMLAFGVGENYDHTGNYIDSPVANWSMMVNPNATFSASAAQALLASGLSPANSVGGPSPQSVTGFDTMAPVPEPTTWSIWLLVGSMIITVRQRLWRRVSA
jgi:hypothetical protein